MKGESDQKAERGLGCPAWCNLWHRALMRLQPNSCALPRRLLVGCPGQPHGPACGAARPKSPLQPGPAMPADLRQGLPALPQHHRGGHLRPALVQDRQRGAPLPHQERQLAMGRWHPLQRRWAMLGWPLCATRCPEAPGNEGEGVWGPAVWGLTLWDSQISAPGPGVSWSSFGFARFVFWISPSTAPCNNLYRWQAQLVAKCCRIFC